MKEIVNEAGRTGSIDRGTDTTVHALEKLGDAVADLDILIEHFDHPAYNPAQCDVMKRVKANIEAVTVLLEEGATQ